jgi:hypothetical protein
MISYPIFSYIKKIYGFQYMLKSNTSVKNYYVELHIAILQLEYFSPTILTYPSPASDLYKPAE